MQLPQPNAEFARRFVAHDGYQVQYLPQNGATSLSAFHFVVKRSYAIEPPGTRPMTLQRPLHLADVYYPGGDFDPLRTPLRYETDLMPPKAACDVVLNGHAYAPGGEARVCVTSLQVGDNPPKRVQVVGDRSAWLPRNGRHARLTGARPWSVMPLRWDYAYGGVDLQAQMGFALHPGNPAGVGFWAAPMPGADAPLTDHFGPLPNLEDPARPLQMDALLVDALKWQSGPQPWSYGWVPKQWEPRVSKAGVPPEARAMWSLIQQIPVPGGKPAQVRDMDPAFYNGAPEGQVIPYPKGGEWVTLEHLHRTEPRLRFRLPVDRPRLRWSLGGGDALHPVKLEIDTLTIEPDLMALDVVWRGTLPAPEGFSLAKFERPPLIEVDGEPVLPAQLLDSGFPLSLITEAHP